MTGRLTRAAALIAAAAALTLAAAPVAQADPSSTGAGRSAGRVAGSYIVAFEPGVARPGARTSRLEDSLGFAAAHRYRHALEGFSARLSERQVEALAHNPNIAFISPDRPVEASAAVPLAAGDSAPTGVRRIEAGTTTSAREAATVPVAVIDSGIDLSHPDLNAIDGKNCVGTGPAADDNGHGTHVAGTIGAKNNGIGVTGVAPGTRVYAVKALDAAGGGTWSQIICAIDWVTSTRTDADASNDIAVANLSLGGPGAPVASCSTTTDPLHKAICASTQAGVTYVVAAGNDGWDFDYPSVPDVPAAYPEVLTVTAMSDDDGRPGALGGSMSCDPGAYDDYYAAFSNFALTSSGAAHTIAAPGDCITSTWPGGGYAVNSGTSMAAPHVAGAVALCFGEGAATGPCSGLRSADVIQRMRSRASLHTQGTGYGFAGDPTRPAGSRYFGYLVWAEPLLRSVTATPAKTSISAGTLRSGGPTQLGSDDNAYYEVSSTTSSTYTVGWVGSFAGVPNSLQSLKTTYKGKSSRSCTQTVALWRWTTSSWVQLDSRSVGTTEVQVDRAPSGALADYVSGTSGDGELRLRVRCTTSYGSFFTSGDLMRISYDRPQ